MKNNGRHNNNTNDNTTNPLCLLAANLLGHSLALLIFFIVFRLLLNNLLNNLAILCLHYATLHYTTLVVTKHCLPGCDLSFAWISTVSYTSLLRPNLVCWIGPSWDFSVGHFSQTFYSLQLHSSSKVYRNSRGSIPSDRLY